MIFTFYASGILKRVKYIYGGLKNTLLREIWSKNPQASAGIQAYSYDSRDRVPWRFPCLTVSWEWKTKSKSIFWGPNLDNVPGKNPNKINTNLLGSSW